MAQITGKIILFLFLCFFQSAVLAQDARLMHAALRAEGQGQWHQALSLYRKILSTTPRAEIWVRIADIQARLDRPELALKAAREAVRLRPGDPELHYRLAQACGVNNRPQEGMQAINQALTLDPDNPKYLRQQAQLAMWLGDIDTAMAASKKILALEPGNRQALVDLARIQSQSGALDKAVVTYSQYREAYPNDPDILLPYAETEIYRGDFHHADRLQKQYICMDGNTRECVKARAGLLARSGHPKEALDMLAPLLAETPGDYELNLYNTLAHNANRNKRAALDSLAELERLGPNRPETGGVGLQVRTPLRPYLGTEADYYNDTDDIRIKRAGIFGGISPTPESSLSASFNRRWLKAPRGSGLEPLTGSREIELDEAWLLGHYQFLPEFGVGAGLGQSENGRGDSETTYRLDVNYWPVDPFTLDYQFLHDVVSVSPRAVDILIPGDSHRLRLGWNNNYLYRVDTELLYTDYDDGNTHSQVTVTPLFVTLRTQRHNLDLGATAQWFSFDKDLNNGYYDPDNYLRLWGVAYYYAKLSDNDGISIALGLGPERDRDLDDEYELGGNLSIRGIFGVYRDWQFIAYASGGGRLTDGAAGSAGINTKTFRYYNFGLQLIRRF